MSNAPEIAVNYMYMAITNMYMKHYSDSSKGRDLGIMLGVQIKSLHNWISFP